MRAPIQLKAILMGAGILALAVGVIVVAFAGIEVFSHQAAVRSGRLAAATAGPTPTPLRRDVSRPTCGVSGKPDCPTPDPGWITFTSTSPGAVLAAMKQTWIFQIDLNDGGDHIDDLSHLGTPFLVRGLAPQGATIADYYVLPIMDAHGVITDIGEFELNVTHTALRFAATTSFDGRFRIVRQTASAAITAVKVQRHVSMRAGTQPYLAFFPIDAYDLETGKVVWKAGGLWPGEPLWLVPGSDGQNYLFGNDDKVYAQREIPMSA